MVGTGQYGWTLDKYYKQTQDITLDPVPVGQSNWTPIGIIYDSFSGGFDGNGYKIYNLTVSLSSSEYFHGFFGRLENGGILENIELVNVNIDGGTCVGGIVGYNNGIIKNCHVSGDIYGYENVGGIAGGNSGQIKNCYTACDIQGYRYVGGVNGQSSGILENCYASGTHYGYAGYFGGISGNCYGIMRNCVALNSHIQTGRGDGGNTFGRLTGQVNATMSNNYARTDLAIWIDFIGSLLIRVCL